MSILFERMRKIRKHLLIIEMMVRVCFFHFANT